MRLIVSFDIYAHELMAKYYETVCLQLIASCTGRAISGYSIAMMQSVCVCVRERGRNGFLFSDMVTIHELAIAIVSPDRLLLSHA